MNERKEIAYRGLKLRKASDGDGRSIEGVAVPFGDIYNDPWDGAETFDRDGQALLPARRTDRRDHFGREPRRRASHHRTNR